MADIIMGPWVQMADRYQQDEWTWRGIIDPYLIGGSGGGGVVPSTSFITNWTTVNKEITIPVDSNNYIYSFDIDWGDGHKDIDVSNNITHTYDVDGEYDIKIDGEFPYALFSGSTQLNEIKNWGGIFWKNFSNSFWNCSNLSVSALDTPNLTEVVFFRTVFRNCPNVSLDITGWDFSNVENMYNAFRDSGCDIDFSKAIFDGNKLNRVDGIIYGTPTSPANYSSLLILADSIVSPIVKTISNPNLKYDASGQAARDSLISKGWNIDDAGLA